MKKKKTPKNNIDNFDLYKAMVENVSDHIIITDKDGLILHANPAVEETTGFLAKEIIGKKAGTSELWGGEMEKSFYKNLWKTIKEDKKSFVGEITNRKKNGKKYIASAKISPVLNETNEAVFFVGVERDITKEKEIDRMKTDFISLVSHQIRTPLAAMKWHLELLNDETLNNLTKDQKDSLQNVNNSNEKMIDLVNVLLDISRIESGRLIIKPEPSNIGDLLNSVLEEVSPGIQKQEIELSVDITNDLPDINLDPNLIGHAFMNLLTNSIKYTEKGGQIHVSIYKKGAEIIAEVTDNGFGIPKKEQKEVFKKFHRGSNVLKIDTEGSGLGLYLTKALIRISGGKIGFESEVGKGTTFWFSLPISGSVKRNGEVTLEAWH